MAADWMNKSGVNFQVDACDLFGKRIMKFGKCPEALAVIKCWTPCAKAAFGVVFDNKPEKVFYEDLLRKNRTDWRVVEWEDDIWETQNVRPMCPQCGHPLLDGRYAWTRCTACGYMEPGVSSTELLGRLRTGDPHRKPIMCYAEHEE